MRTNPVVLLVDDHEAVRKLIAAFLGLSGFTVEQARDGLEALRNAEHILPDVVVTDLLLPVMDGFALCRELKAVESLAHTPVIGITAHAFLDDEETGTLGFERVLPKDGGLEALLAEVRKAVARSGV